jgi:hypothetical protein
MASEFTVPQIISFAQNSQVNSELKIAQNLAFMGGNLDTNYSRKLYILWKSVNFVNNSNPLTSTLRQVAEYTYALSRPFIVNAATISITNPSNQSVNVGGTANFSVSVFVSNATPFTIQWFRNSMAIPGATSTTYTLTNAQLSDSGATFNAIATAVGVGQAVSATATITVTAPLFGFFAFSNTIDYHAILLTNSDPFAYSVTFPITHNAPIPIPLPSAMPANQFLLAKIPVGESIKTIWANTPLNQGNIPDSVFESVIQFGGFSYYSSRGQVSMDVTQPLILS